MSRQQCGGVATGQCGVAMDNVNGIRTVKLLDFAP